MDTWFKSHVYRRSESLPFSSRHTFIEALSSTSYLLTIVPLATRGHGNASLDSNEPAGAADTSDVPTAAMLQARSFGSAHGSSLSSAQVWHSLPSCSLPVARLARAHCLTVATGSSRSSVVHTEQGYLCPWWHSQAVKQLWFGRTLLQYLVITCHDHNGIWHCFKIGHLALFYCFISCHCTPWL